MPAASVQFNVFCHFLKCPAERFEGIEQCGGGAVIGKEDRSSQDLADGVDRIRCLSGQIRPRPHPPDKYATFSGPCPIEPCPAGPGPKNRKPLDRRGFDCIDWPRQGMPASEDFLVRPRKPIMVCGLVRGFGVMDSGRDGMAG